MEEYKSFEVERNGLDSAILDQLSVKYPKKDIFFEWIEDSIIVHLNQVDFSAFKKDIETLAQSQSANSSTETLFAILDGIESIRSYGLKGKKRLYVSYNKERKVKNRTRKVEKRHIHFYANGNGFSTTNNEIPPAFENKIVCGDSEAVLKQLPDNCVDLVFTSPPYNFGLDYSSNEDDHQWKNYFDTLFRIFGECIRVVKYGGRIIVNVQPLFSDYIPTHHIISNFFTEKKLIWKGEILWEKNNYNCKYTAWGSWKSPSSPYLKYTWEFLEIFAKGTLKKDGNAKDVDISAEEFKKWVVGKWSIAPERNMRDYGHPAMFPEELAERALKLFSFQNDIILDPFNGAGTSTFVAKRLQRRYLGIDVSKEYCKIAQQRVDSTLF